MDNARDKHTLDPIDSIDLWLIDNVDKNGYICSYCFAKANPCSFKRHNKKRPYFKFDNGHEDGCTFEVSDRLKKIGSKKSISTIDGFPLNYPSSIDLSTNQYKANNNIKNQNKIARKIPAYINDKSSQALKINKQHNYSVKTINSIAKFFLNFPHDRKNLSLHVPNIHGNTYHDVIKWLPYNQLSNNKKKRFENNIEANKEDLNKYKVNDNKIFVSTLNHYKPLKTTNKYILIGALGGRWYEDNNSKIKPDKLYNIKINITKLPESKIEYICALIKISQKEFQEDRNRKHYLFFYGKQNEDSIFEFIVDDYRLFTCVEKD